MRTWLPRQLFGLYFRRRFIDLGGESRKWGLDKIFARVREREISNEIAAKKGRGMEAAPFVVLADPAEFICALGLREAERSNA